MSGSRAYSAASAVLLGAVLAGVAFGAGGGTQLGRTSVTELLLILLCGAVAAAAVLRAPSGRMYGGLTLAAFAAYAAVIALSITWSVAPELTYVEAGRMLAYLAAFAAAVAAARLAPRASATAVKGVLIGALAVVGYALASRVFPGTLAPNELSNRIGEPFGYWNAVGTTAAMVVPAALWLGARRTGSAAGRALAYPGLGLAVVAILLTQSRGALAAALIGGALWFLLVPLRLRSLPVALIPSAAAAPVAAWALSKDAFSKSLQPLEAKQGVAGEFGLLLLLLAVVLLAVGFAVNLGLARSAPSMRLRRRVGIAAAAVACLIPLALLTSVASSDRGLGGTLNDRVDELTSSNDAAPSEGAGRFAAASNTRGKYWSEAGKIFDERPALGTGSGTFGIARLRFRTDDAVSRHAHGYVPQTLADTGLLGLAAALALLAAWLAAALRTTGLTPRLRRFGGGARRRDWDSDRTAMVALVLVPVVFGLQSIIDWTWFVPGPAVMGLVAAGYVAGRGPLAAALAGNDEATLVAPPAPARERPGAQRILAAVGLLACALLFAWTAWQPEASDRHSNRALELSDQGDQRAARAEAKAAADANPLSPEPLLVQGAVETRAGRVPAAQAALERAVLGFPGDPQNWLRLAAFQLGTRDDPAAALDTVEGALYLDPLSKPSRQLFLEARARLRAKR
ncbi:MAG TPA: O-antigen ligase family protein, partial [Vicinamibacteria bacterium]